MERQEQAQNFIECSLESVDKWQSSQINIDSAMHKKSTPTFRAYSVILSVVVMHKKLLCHATVKNSIFMIHNAPSFHLLCHFPSILIAQQFL